jgi:hypothetical protein
LISATVLSVVMSSEGGRGPPMEGPSIICCGLCSKTASCTKIEHLAQEYIGSGIRRDTHPVPPESCGSNRFLHGISNFCTRMTRLGFRYALFDISHIGVERLIRLRLAPRFRASYVEVNRHKKRPILTQVCYF